MELPELVIKCLVDPDDGQFAGFLFGPQGQKIGTVSGTVPVPFFAKSSSNSPTGRPRDVTVNIAVLAHVDMGINILGKTLRAAQLFAADQLHIGSDNNPESQRRAVQRHIAKARSTLAKKGIRLFSSADTNKENVTQWMFFDVGTKVTVSGELPNGPRSLLLEGNGWICKQGEAKARRGVITLPLKNMSEEVIQMVTESLGP